MYKLIARIAVWLLEKAAVVVLILVLGLGGYAAYLYLQENGEGGSRRAEQTKALAAEQDRLSALREQLERTIAEYEKEVENEKLRVERAGKILASLAELESWWERLFGNAEQQRINRERAEKVEQTRRASLARIPELQRAITHATWEREGVELSLNQIRHQLALSEESKSQVIEYLREAWYRARWYILGALAAYLFGPTLWRTFLFFVWAPVLKRGRPLRFTESPGDLPEVSPSHVSIDVPLWPGERVRIREKYLQASDEGLSRKTRFLLDWSIPFTSAACGLIELIELQNGRAVGEQRVTFSNADDPHIELAVVQVPAGSSLVLRPSFLAGVITHAGEKLTIRRRWQILRWVSWITLQFRFFELVGPCRLILAGTRGIRAERLGEREAGFRPSRRANQRATIGFTPGLEYSPVRAETFWSYYRGMNPLFDDLFTGTGVFICQETAKGAEEGRVGRFWTNVWNGVLKVFGL